MLYPTIDPKLNVADTPDNSHLHHLVLIHTEEVTSCNLLDLLIDLQVRKYEPTDIVPDNVIDTQNITNYLVVFQPLMLQSTPC